MSIYEERRQVLECREQIQEDIRVFMMAFPGGYITCKDGTVKATSEYMTDTLCEIVLANFNKLNNPQKGQFNGTPPTELL